MTRPKAIEPDDRCTAVLDYNEGNQSGIRCRLEPHDPDVSHKPGPWERMSTNEYLALSDEWVTR